MELSFPQRAAPEITKHGKSMTPVVTQRTQPVISSRLFCRLRPATRPRTRLRRLVEQLERAHVRGEHLLLGLLRSSVAARELLLALDVDPLVLRRSALLALTDGG